MPVYLIVVRPLHPAPVPALDNSLRELGMQASSVRTERRYVVMGELDRETAGQLADLLNDPLLATARVIALDGGETPAAAHDDRRMEWAIDVAYRPGVTDNEGESVAVAAERAGIAGVRAARTVERVIIEGDLSRVEAERIAHQILANDLVEAAQAVPPLELSAVANFYRSLITPPAPTSARITVLPLREADDSELARISREGVLALDAVEMQAIQSYFRDLERDPTDGELETLAQTWSEHCSHKTFKALIDYREMGNPSYRLGDQVIDGLLKSFLMRATEAVRPTWLLSAFEDNAGIVASRAGDAISFKVETHNHPSALEPFGGANTGVGGVVRDVLGVSAKPIANIDVLCFGPGELAPEALPPGVIHPARITEGVVAGIRDYGNKLGVPTVAGAVLYDPGYIRNPLVFCGTLGLAPRSAYRTGAQPGDAVVLVGGRTGRDGIHGATFSSEELTHDTVQIVGTAVQIGDPITEKMVIDALLQASEQGLYRAITDCGAGGLSSAVGEMGADTGVTVELQDVPLKYPGLQPWEVWVSEAQERMVLAVPPATLSQFLALCHAEDVAATVIGRFTEEQRLVVTARGEPVVDLDMEFLHRGRPQRQMTAVWAPSVASDPPLPQEPPKQTLLALLAHPTIASKEGIVRTYDHLVQGRTVQGPLGGIAGSGPTDAAVLHLHHDGSEAVAVGVGINPRYGLIDPYWMALAAVDEAVRNVVAVGADPSRIALLDNFCWGDPRQPDRLAGLVRATAACHDAAVAWHMPFISGKDSLNNEYRDVDGERVPIPPTLLISALGMLSTVAHVTSSDLKAAGNRLYLVGTTERALGGSHWLLLHDALGSSVPRVDLKRARATFEFLHRAIAAGLVQACHDLSEGGLGVAAAEMVIAGELGLRLELASLPFSGDGRSDDLLLWSESPSRFLVEVAPAQTSAFENLLAGVPHACCGTVMQRPALEIMGLDGHRLLTCELAELTAAWRRNDKQSARPE